MKDGIKKRKRNLVKICKIVWNTTIGQKDFLPDTIIINLVKDLGLKNLNNVDVLADDEGPVYLVDIIQEYLLTKYKCPADTFELDYVY